MTSGQIKFWSGIRNFARLTRTAKNVDLAAAADALDLESQADAKLKELEEITSLAAARRDPALTQRDAQG